MTVVNEPVVGSIELSVKAGGPVGAPLSASRSRLSEP